MYSKTLDWNDIGFTCFEWNIIHKIKTLLASDIKTQWCSHLFKIEVIALYKISDIFPKWYRERTYCTVPSKPNIFLYQYQQKKEIQRKSFSLCPAFRNDDWWSFISNKFLFQASARFLYDSDLSMKINCVCSIRNYYTTYHPTWAYCLTYIVTMQHRHSKKTKGELQKTVLLCRLNFNWSKTQLRVKSYGCVHAEKIRKVYSE